MGGRPSKQTSADKRLTANKTNAKPAAKSTGKPAFGSAAWDAKYSIKRKGK